LHLSPLFVVPAHFTVLGLWNLQKVVLFAALFEQCAPFWVVPEHLAFAVVSGLE
jgi:hypothetical protein